MSKVGRAYKKVPSFWWDFGDKPDEVIVESDDDRFNVVGRFKYNPKGGQGCAMKAIEQAERLIADLKAGRAKPRAC